MKPTINIKPGESAPMAIIRLYKHIRRLDRDYEPCGRYAAQVKSKQAQLKTRLRAIK